tara:strand:+ start:270 stop:752 length:483 start_codon:yes stop_codon:yes gene_type:complete
MAFKLNSGNNPSFKMMGADSPKKMKAPMDMKSPMDMEPSPKKFNEKLENEVEKGNIKGKFAKAINNASDSPNEMKSPMPNMREAGMSKIRGAGIGMHQRGLFRKTEDDSAMEMEAAMKLKSAMDMAKDGPMNLMEESPKKLTQDAAMKMAAAMKRYYNQD